MRLIPILLLAAAIFVTACAGTSQTTSRDASGKDKSSPNLMLSADAMLTGHPSIVRVQSGLQEDWPFDFASWDWDVGQGQIIAREHDKRTVWIEFHKPNGNGGSAMVQLEAIDTEGNRSRAQVRIDQRNDADAAPVCLLDISPAADRDGAHHLRFGKSLLLDGALSYDPEGYADPDNGSPAIEERRGIASYEWSMYRDTDSDDDGVLDYVLIRTGGSNKEIEIVEYRNGDSSVLSKDGDGNCPVDLDGDGEADILIVNAFFNPKEYTVKKILPQSAGTYVFELSVTDNSGQQARKNGTVKFFNEAK